MNKTIELLSELLFDIQCDNEVTFYGEWSDKDKKLAESINLVLDYLNDMEEK